MARLGKRERLAKRQVFTAWRDYRQSVVSNNLSQPKPKLDGISMVPTKSGFVAKIRDETAMLKGNSHTRGISIGQREYRYQKPGTFKKS